MKPLSIAALACCLLFSHAPARAAVTEQVLTLPVAVMSAKGERVERSIPVTVFRDDARPVGPFAILIHGRMEAREGRARYASAGFAEFSRYLVAQGFTVFLPIRLGYGASVDDDVESRGDPCDSRDMPSTIAPGTAQTLAVLELARRQPYVDKDRGLLFGTSFGGMIALTAAAQGAPGVLGVINLSGGGSGLARQRPDHPCNVQSIAAAFGDAGKGAPLPTLWLYAENDRNWGPTHPREWHQLYTQAGGKAQFVQFPPVGTEGHAGMIENQGVWRPTFERFLRETLAFPPPLQ